MTREDGADGVHLRVRLSAANAARFAQRPAKADAPDRGDTSALVLTIIYY